MIKTRLIQLLGKAKRYVILQVFWQWLSLLAQVWIIKNLADLITGTLAHTLTTEQMYFTLLMIILLIFARYVLDRLYGKAGFMASADVKGILREKIYEKLLRLGPSYRESVSTAEIVQETTEGVEQLETYFSRYLSQFFYALLAPITLFIVLLPVSVKCAAILLAAVPLIPIIIMIVMKVARRILDGYFKIYYGLADTFLEKLQGLTILKMYDADAKAAEDIAAESENFRLVTMKVLGMQLVSTAIMDLAAYGGTALGFVTALGAFASGMINLHGMILILFLGAEFFLPMRLLGSYFHIGMNGMKACDKIFAFLDLDEQEDGHQTIPNGKMDVQINDLSFSYDNERQILKHVSLSIPQGSFVSLVGMSGSGKSTLAGILMKQNRNYTGQITMGDVSLKELSTTHLMKHVTCIHSHSYLFKGTIRDNLCMGAPEADDTVLKQALHTVRLDAFADDLDMQIQEKAANLSGGERQRLALARALLHDTDMYLIDEATSNIDVESEEAIMDVLHTLKGKKTVLLISHRLMNVVDSDQIYLLQDGAIVESGTHESLMAAHGSYATMFQKQKDLENVTKESRATKHTPLVLHAKKETMGDSSEPTYQPMSAGMVMKKLIVLVKPLGGIMALAIVLGVVGFLCAIFVSVASAYGISLVINGKSISSICILVLILGLVRGLLHYGEQYGNHYIAFRLLALIRLKVFDALRKLAPAKLDGQEKGNLIQVLTSDIELLEVFFAHTISPSAIAILTSLIMVIFIGCQYRPAAWLALAGYLIIGLVLPLRNTRRNTSYGLDLRNAFGEMNSALLDSIYGLNETIQYAYQERTRALMKQKDVELMNMQKKLSTYESENRALTNLMIQVFSWLMIILMLSAYSQGKTSHVAVLLAITAMMNSFGPVAALSSLSSSLTQTIASGNRVLSILEEKPAIDEKSGHLDVTSFQGAQFSNVCFAYKNQPILSDVSLTIEPHRIIGIHGPSGCGKSTILKLLMRFYDVQAGQVLINGKNIKDVKMDALHRMISFVAQDTWLFGGTIADNISLRLPNVKREDIVQAAKMANIDDLISSLEDGYDTKLAELGTSLSDGEKQRIGLARAFLHQGELLLLDEPTSNLDALNEGVLLHALTFAGKGKTIVLISHRASTLAIADEIFEIND